jgi:hypothetical protein
MGAGFGRQMHRRIAFRRPAMAGKAGERNMQFRARCGMARMTVEQPLHRVVGIRLRQAAWIPLKCNGLPMRKGKRNLHERCVSYCDLPINSSYGLIESWVRAIRPQGKLVVGLIGMIGATLLSKISPS